LLLDSLQAAGLYYEEAVLQELTELQVPGLATYTDRDVILVRSDLPPGHLKVLGSEKHIYDVLMPFPVLGDVIEVGRGWIAVDVKIRGARFKFVNTHLEAPIFDLPATQAIQFAQAMQLVDDLNAIPLPIILAGDFNSDAEPTEFYPPDATPSYDYIVASGYVDAWEELNPEDPGFSWPLFLESPQADDGVMPIERIDLIFSDESTALSISRTGVDPVDGLYASDHTGMVAEFGLFNHRPYKANK
jgi:endonuclease/exonuclease/phosphatase family metal-dependent hydrolase